MDARARPRRFRRSSRPGGAAARTEALQALIVDLDRTLAHPGRRLGATASASVQEAGALGLAVILVSGREQRVLRSFARLLPGLHALVAENGAVVESPLGRPPRLFGRAVAHRARRRLAEITDLEVASGEVIASVARRDVARVRAAVADLPVELVANVDRCMVVPRGIDKLSGTRAALRGLGLGRARFAAIGDGENDLPVLRAADLSGAVANAVPAVLRTVAYRCRAPRARGVLEFVRGPVADRAPRPRRSPR